MPQISITIRAETSAPPEPVVAGARARKRGSGGGCGRSA
jgi:hypothetical protein